MMLVFNKNQSVNHLQRQDLGERAGCHQSEEQKTFRVIVCEVGGGDVI